MTVFERFEQLKKTVEAWGHGLYHGMIEHPATENLEARGEDTVDELFFGLFADAFGIPNPVSYYAVELLPYIAEDFEKFERRMWDRQTMIERAGKQYHF